MTRHRNLPLSTFVPGNSIIHRISPSIKIALLIAFILLTSIFFSTVWTALGGLAIAIALYVVARIPVNVIAGQWLPPLFILIPLTAFQWWAKGSDYALTLFLNLFSAMGMAFLLTLTSTVDDILNSLENSLRPLEKFGLPSETIALTMSLTIRLIPLMFETAYEVLDARKARGAAFSPLAFGTPVIIRSMRRARAIGEALQARGVGDS